MKELKDPVTGDTLTLGEYISWKVQGIIRNWFFLILVTLVTIFVWTTNNPIGLLWWNLCASYLAIVIESIVGISMFSQTKRDAVIIRNIETIQQNQMLLLTHLDEQDKMIMLLLNRIEQTVDLEQQEIDQIIKGRSQHGD